MSDDYVDFEVDLERRVRKQELRRNDGETARAPIATHNEPIAEWLSIPSAVPREEFSIGREAWALWEAEQDIYDPDFHMFVRMARECARVIKRLISVGSIAMHQHEALPIMHGLSATGWNGTAVRRPSAILVEQAPGWYTKILVPAAPRIGRLDTGVSSVPALGGNSLIDHPGEVGRGIIPGQYAYYSPISTPPNLRLSLVPEPNFSDDLLAPLDDVFLVHGPNGPMISGFDRGMSYRQAPEYAVVPGVNDGFPVVVGAGPPFDIIAPTAGVGFPQCAEYWPLPFPLGDGNPSDYARNLIPADAPIPKVTPTPFPITDYQGNQVGWDYFEGPAMGLPGIGLICQTTMVYCWGAPVSMNEVEDEDPNDPSDELLGFIHEQVAPGGTMTLGGGIPLDFPTPHFDEVVERVHAGVVPLQLQGWIDAVLREAGETSTEDGYEHQWHPFPGEPALEWLERFGVVHLRGILQSFAVDMGHVDGPPPPAGPIVGTGVQDGIVYRVHLRPPSSGAAWVFVAEQDPTITTMKLDGFSYPADA